MAPILTMLENKEASSESMETSPWPNYQRIKKKKKKEEERNELSLL
jgi:hypothetical protein